MINSPPPPPDQSREEALFALALEKPQEKRAAFLEAVCEGDPALRQRLEALLAAHESPDELSTKVTRPGMATMRLELPDIEDEAVGQTLGRYKLLERVGEGGCGVVYVAEQTEPVRRRVALKVIKLGMDTKSVVARFEAERQALAMMDHPNIAKVLDAGATEAGRPYFVMELVRGIRITHYCDQNNLTTAERLELFIKVCQAIQHAHQKGIIHRDIKPSNILVTLHDGAPVPKVIDFGIAKATEGRLTDATVYTELHQFMGTPAYTSPEQAEMSGLDIDTRTDIYSLGVLLYELVAGSTPFDAKELIASGLDGMRKTIREEEPMRPSTRFGTLKGEELTATARRRSTDSVKLMHQLEGDLDWIVMKCLEKDRIRRYDTANGLAMDLKRHLNNETVMACPPTNWYRLQKLVRRNKLVFLASGAVAAALVLGVIASVILAVRATRAEREQIQLRLLAQADEKTARTETAKATAISGFLQQALRSANPDQLKGSDYSVRQLLDDFSAGLENQFADQPEVEASVRATLGQTYYRLGLADKSQAQMEQALKLRRRIFGANEVVAATLADYAWTSFEQRQFPRGEAQAREALDIYERLGTMGQPVIAALWALQENLESQERYREVEQVTAEALAMARKTPTVEYPEIASMIHGLAQVKIAQTNFVEAEALSRQAVEMHRRLRGPQHPETGWALLCLGHALEGQNKLDEAEAATREALAIFRKQYAAGHKSVDAAMSQLKDILVAGGSAEKLAKFYGESLASQRTLLGTNSPVVAETLMNMADALQAEGSQGEAEKARHEAASIAVKVDYQDPASVPQLVRRQTEALQTQGHAKEAEQLFEDAINVIQQKLGETNIVLGELQHDYGEFLAHEDKFKAAAEHHYRALKIRQAQPPDDNLAWTLRDLGGDLVLRGRPQEAESYFRESLAVYRKLHRREDIYATGWTTERLGYALTLQGRIPEAETAYREALNICVKCDAVGGDFCAVTVRSLMEVFKTENKLAEGETLCRELLSRRHAASTNDNPAVASMICALADNLTAQGKRPEAEASLREAIGIFRQSTMRNPTVSDNFSELGHVQWQLGRMLEADGQLAEAEQRFLDAAQVFEKAGKLFPGRLYLRQEEAFSHRLLGHVMELPGRWDESEKHYTAAIGIYADLATINPRDPFYLGEECYTAWNLATVLDRAGQTDRAIDEFRTAAALDQKGIDIFPDEKMFKQRGITALCNLGDLLSRLKRNGEARETYRDALQVCAVSEQALGDECAHATGALAEMTKLENQNRDAVSPPPPAVAQQK